MKHSKKHKLIPSFIKILCSIDNKITKKVIKHAEQYWLNTNLSEFYSKLQSIERDLYSLHMSILRHLDNDVEYLAFETFRNKVEEKVKWFINKKRYSQKKKIHSLMLNSHHNEKPKVKLVDNYISNLSNKTIPSKDLNLLNLGLHYAPKPTNINLEKPIVEIETMIKYLPQNGKESIRRDISEVFSEIKNQKNCKFTEYKTLNNLRKQDLYFLKADKGNSMVIVEKQKYEKDILNIVSGKEFQTVNSRNPLPKMLKEVNECVRNCESILGISKKFLTDPNSEIPSIYALYKTHKEGMRPIIANVNSPTTRMAKYLVSVFNDLNKSEGFYIKK